jgi:hypothetical protein
LIATVSTIALKIAWLSAVSPRMSSVVSTMKKSSLEPRFRPAAAFLFGDEI